MSEVIANIFECGDRVPIRPEATMAEMLVVFVLSWAKKGDAIQDDHSHCNPGYTGRYMVGNDSGTRNPIGKQFQSGTMDPVKSGSILTAV
eukprot:6360643-Ditylum_brightwellii.AAC.1